MCTGCVHTHSAHRLNDFFVGGGDVLVGVFILVGVFLIPQGSAESEPSPLTMGEGGG